MKRRPCLHCGTPHSRQAGALYCSRRCSVAVDNIRQNARYAASHPRPTQRPCAFCDRAFSPSRAPRLYCSDYCRGKARRIRADIRAAALAPFARAEAAE